MHKNGMMVLSLCVVLTVNISANTRVFGANMLEHNSSFEVGRWGYDVVPGVFVRNWDNYPYPVITDKTAAHGRYSLLLSNPSGMDYVAVFFPPFKVIKETPITVSFFARADRPGARMSAAITCGFKRIMSGYFKLSKEWKRYSFSGVLAKDIYNDYARKGVSSESWGKKGYYALCFQLPSARVKVVFGRVWLDAIQVQRGGVTGYEVGNPLEVGVDLKKFHEKHHLVYCEDETDNAVLRLFSMSGKGECRVSYKVQDELNSRVYANDAIKVQLDASGHGQAEFALPPMKRGLYRIVVEARTGDMVARACRVYGVIRDLRRIRKDGPIFFGGSIGTFEPARAYRTKPGDSTYRLVGDHMSPDAYFDLAARVGWQWVHFYRVISPLVNARKADERDWRDSDYMVDLARKHGLDVMSLLTSHGATKRLPKWMLSDRKSLGGNSSGKGSPIPDADAYAGYCEEAARHFRGRITWWESWNEPGVKMRVAEYMPLLKACWRGIKKGNPQARVLGLTGTWDRSGDLYGWVKRCMKLGAADYMDAIAIHGYHTRDRLYGANVRRIAHKICGRDLPIWDTESGRQNSDPYGFGTVFNDQKLLTNPLVKASTLTQHVANELACGMARHSWFNLATTYNHLGKSSYSMLAFDGSPNPDLISHNAMIELLMGARFVREIPIEGDTVAYLFKLRSGSPLCIYWNPCLEKTSMDIPVACDRLELMDVFCRPLAFKGTKVVSTVPLDANTRYIRGKGMTVDELGDILVRTIVKGLTPIRLECARLGMHAGRPAIVGEFRNVRNIPLTVKFRVTKKPLWLKVAVPPQVMIEALASIPFVWPLAVDRPGKAGDLEIVAETADTSILLKLPSHILFATKATEKISVDANSGEKVWQKATVNPLGAWGTVQACWNQDGLYFLARVRDNEIVNYHERDGVAGWKTDCLELFFDWDRESDLQNPVFNGDDTQLILAIKGREGTVDEVQHGPDKFAGNAKFPLDRVRMVSRRTPVGYDLEVCIPWDCLDALGQKRVPVIGFSMAGRDVDHDFNQRQRPIWQGTDVNYKNTTGFGLLILEGLK